MDVPVLLGACSAAAAVLLLVAGAAKLRRPTPAATMIVAFWPALRPLRRARRVARFIGVVELAGGASTLVVGGRFALALLAGCYLVLLLVAIRLTTGDRQAACGCFGAADGVVGPAHVVLNLACLTAASAALVHPPGSVAALFDDGALVGVGICAQALLLAALGYLAITAFPALSSARRTVEGIS